MTTENQTSAGELLRQGRLRQHLSIGECTKRTHIAGRFIEALEEGRWNDLPSESHRLGFLKLYSRFLGIPSEEVLSLYKKIGSGSEPLEPSAGSKHAGEPVNGSKVSREPSPWSPNSMPQLIGFGIVALLLFWLIYHAVIPRLFEQNPMPWVRHSTSHQARLVVPKTSITNHKVTVKAAADSWIRVTSHNQLLFEGILPATASKEWSGPGPFQLKIGNVRALSVFWNDQPVDILLGSHQAVNEIRIPPQ